MSKQARCFVGDRYVYKDVEYFAGKEKDKYCAGCAFNIDGIDDIALDAKACAKAPPGCGGHGTIWLTKQNYITNRLMT